MNRRIRVLRAAARKAGYRLHYDNIGKVYSLHGSGHFYGMTIEEAEARVLLLPT